jgi:hypothetical protein
MKRIYCVRCGRWIDSNRLVCHHCGKTQPRIGDFGDIPTLEERYKDLVYKQAIDGLTDREYIELEELEYVKKIIKKLHG